MTASQRRHLYSGLLLGAAVTIFVTILDAAGGLSGMENWIYNQRALRCQHFAPPPTTQLVHLDVDDAALEELGRWPWPRSVLADVIEELRLDGAKVIALDVIMPEPQNVEVRRDHGQVTEIDHDGVLAAALRRQAGVLVPVSLTFGKPEPRTQRTDAIVHAFELDLERRLPDVRARLAPTLGDVSTDELINARRDAIAARVQKEMSAGTTAIEDLQKKLLPQTWGTPDGTALGERVREEAELERSRIAIRRLARDVVPAKSLQAVSALLPTARLAEAARYTGFVDHLLFNDGVVRAVPLWVQYDGVVYPQMGMEMACAMLGIPVSAVRIEPGRVIIPKPGGDLSLPISRYWSDRLGGWVPLMSVPWFGTDAWQTMYDWPDHRNQTQHVPVGTIAQAARARRQVAVNNQQADLAMGDLADALGMDAIKALLKNPPPATEPTSRFDPIRQVLAEVDKAGYVEPLKTKPRDQMDADERKLIDAYDALGKVLRGNQTILDDQAALHSQFAGKAVLLGSVASGAADFVSTPLHAQCPGAVVHGAVFNAVMTGNVWTAVPGWLDTLSTISVGLILTVAVAWLSPWQALLAMVVIVGGYLGLNGYVVFDWGKHIMGAAGPVVAAGGVWGVVTVSRYIVERAEGERVRGRFRSYVDEQLVDYVLEHPDVDVFEGQEQELSVAFTDMKGFTTLMERLGKRVVPVLNEYMNRMVAIVRENDGLVNKFLGDGMMFFYGAPRPNHDHAADAVATVLAMQVAIEEFNRWLATQGLTPVAVRAGVTTGFVVVGDAGDKRRADYTVLGDSVNLASRLESANKFFGTSIMISARTLELLDGRFLVRPIGRLRVVGKTAWVMAYEPLARTGDQTPAQRDLAAVTTRMFGAFVAADFPACEAAAADAVARFGPHRLFEMYQSLARRHREHGTPTPFEGVVELTEK